MDTLTVADIARELGVSRMTVYQYRDRCGLPLGDRGRIGRAAFTQWQSTFTPPTRGRPKRPSRWQWVIR